MYDGAYLVLYVQSMERSAEQLDIDLEVHARITGTVAGGEVSSIKVPPEESGDSSTSVESPPDIPFDEVVLTVPGRPDAKIRTSPDLGPRLNEQIQLYVTEIEARGLDLLGDVEVRQWLDDYEIVRAHCSEAAARLLTAGQDDPARGATRGGLYAETIERLVGKRAQPAYRGETIPELESLFDPHSLVRKQELTEESAEAEAPADQADVPLLDSYELEQEELDALEAELQGDTRAASAAADPTRLRAKVAIARTVCLEMHPEWRVELAAR